MLLLVLGCAFITDTEKDARRDADGDGVESVQWGGADCNDNDKDIGPHATESCNGVDDDCNGEIDDVADGVGTRYYIDADGDGHGAAAFSDWACEPPQGYVESDDDCDDTENRAYPGADEVCDGFDNDCDGEVDADDDDLQEQVWYADVDTDGWGDDNDAVTERSCDDIPGRVLEGGDCDDTRADINPDGAEVCNRLDDDCDGLIDDEDEDTPLFTWYADLDADGYGDVDETVDQCEAPAGYLSNAEDCDDADPNVYPGADEYCDGVDQDCDGDIDDDAIDELIWYADDDNDGWGDESDTRFECTAPSGYVADAGDCDDNEATTYPGAEESCTGGVDSNCDGSVNQDADEDGYLACEDCDDSDPNVNPAADEVCNGVDDDCDGDIDDDDSSVLSSSQTTYYADSDGDGYGDATSSTDACEEPSGYVEDDDDCDDSTAKVNPDMWEICNDGLDNDCDGFSNDCTLGLGDADARLVGVTGGDRSGECLAVGDVDNDGADDIAIGASGGGSVYLVYGSVSSGTLSSATEWTQVSSGDEAGASLDAFDTDADGQFDLAVGAPGAGAAYVLLGPASAGGSLSGAAGIISGDSGDAFGGTLTALSNDGNGTADLVVGAVEAGSTLSPNQGAVYLFTGPVTGSLTASGADGVIEGFSGDELGRSLTGGDTDGDGYDETFVGGYANGTLGTGGVYAFAGPWSNTLGSDDADATLTAPTMEGAGNAVATLDYDGDGYADVVVGSSTASSNRGKVYLLLGPVTSDTSLNSADLVFTGPTSGRAGTSLGNAGDLNNDGADELIIGGSAMAWLDIGNSSTGAVSLGSADLDIDGENSGHEAGAWTGTGDVDGDGDPDLVVGAPGYGSDKGATYLISGAGF